MARPRLSNRHHEVTGAKERNPGRFKGRPGHKEGDLGDPPEHLNDAQAAAWRLFRAELPWLAKADRALVEIGAVVRAEIAAGRHSLRVMNELRQLLTAMGATPSARSRIMAPSDPAPDPLDEFTN